MIIFVNAVLVAALLSVFLTYANNRWGSPLVAIANRWLRWLLFAALATLLAEEFAESGRPLWIYAVTGFLSWFLIETMFNWIAIKALSQSPVPLFPRFRESGEAQEWPVQKRFLQLRDWIRNNGFSLVQNLKSDLGMGIKIRSSVFQSSDKRIRLQVFFIPQRSGNVTECVSLQSITKDGRRIVTDNLYIPFGGFFPETWSVARKAWIRSVPRLCRRHQARIATLELEEWDDEPVDDLNYQQLLLERVNTELGFLYPRHLRDEYGKLTTEGRYRVWKEIWLLNYLGLSTSK